MYLSYICIYVSMKYNYILNDIYFQPNNGVFPNGYFDGSQQTLNAVRHNHFGKINDVIIIHHHHHHLEKSVFSLFHICSHSAPNH